MYAFCLPLAFPNCRSLLVVSLRYVFLDVPCSSLACGELLIVGGQGLKEGLFAVGWSDWELLYRQSVPVRYCHLGIAADLRLPALYLLLEFHSLMTCRYFVDDSNLKCIQTWRLLPMAHYAEKINAVVEILPYQTTCPLAHWADQENLGILCEKLAQEYAIWTASPDFARPLTTDGIPTKFTLPVHVKL